jgi:hypothetical protein
MLKDIYELRVLEKRVLRKINGANKKAVTRDWRSLHNEELQNS